MDYCRTFGLSYQQLRQEPMWIVRRWRQFLNAEARGHNARNDLERMKSEARRGRN